jgi:hypothetical protein
MDVRNLHGTTMCKHYQGLPMKKVGEKCARNGCTFRDGMLFRCHVIKGSTNFISGTRYVVYMCTSCNQMDELIEVRANTWCPEILNCDCGVDLDGYIHAPGQYVRDEGEESYQFYSREPVKINAQKLFEVSRVKKVKQ